jgi:hypothetical protein
MERLFPAGQTAPSESMPKDRELEISARITSLAPEN